ncbi:helix-turn-helix domain-containing protein [Agrobacterium tumefaciens]|uniref:Helix-turn-helix transcriptional regulator n=1 Tax=Agrobacterium tumefaciens TaxID=358 RepID=A0AA44J9K2_AGRTU|nr:helix-turn-helix transcriptional regulator [Agrobacterium tumefaciens]NTB87652.1 helix-turn-helix transcriptional regulator [Agrobacterium tumefaciens]NTC19980.1 helix-turn-helix transcriptional regulator [Agrobacterium tumefaciens]NTC29799.1 helix-turn-helix transcriptional regulator [Agrobacterium tumefaciens]
MSKNLDSYIAELGLVKTADPENEKPVYRREGLDGISTFEELDARLGEKLRECRQAKDLSRADLATLVGLSEQVYGRYERSSSRMQVSRLIHLSEILGISPLGMLFAAAPHLWGKTPEEADTRFRMIRLLDELPTDTMASIVTLLETVSVLQQTPKKDPTAERP